MSKSSETMPNPTKRKKVPGHDENAKEDGASPKQECEDRPMKKQKLASVPDATPDSTPDVPVDTETKEDTKKEASSSFPQDVDTLQTLMMVMMMHYLFVCSGVSPPPAIYLQ